MWGLAAGRGQDTEEAYVWSVTASGTAEAKALDDFIQQSSAGLQKVAQVSP